MNHTISYQEKPMTAGRHVLVIRAFRIIGTIRSDPVSGIHRYYHGVHNELNPEMEDPDLNTLKAKISTEHSSPDR